MKINQEELHLCLRSFVTAEVAAVAVIVLLTICKVQLNKSQNNKSVTMSLGWPLGLSLMWVMTLLWTNEQLLLKFRHARQWLVTAANRACLRGVVLHKAVGCWYGTADQCFPTFYCFVDPGICQWYFAVCLKHVADHLENDQLNWSYISEKIIHTITVQNQAIKLWVLYIYTKINNCSWQNNHQIVH